MKQPNSILKSVFVLLFVFMATSVAKPALAHERVEIGPYVIVVGWVHEPAIVGERNALFLSIHEGEEPVVGAEATLDATLEYGGREFRSNLNPTAVPGEYNVEIFPTIRGQYGVQLTGSLGETEIDELVEPEEVFDAARLQFPETQPSIREVERELQTEIEALQDELKTARFFSYAGLGLALLGIVLGALGMRRK